MTRKMFTWNCSECDFALEAMPASDGFRSSDRYGRGLAAAHGKSEHGKTDGSWQYWLRKVASMPLSEEGGIVFVTSPTGRENRYAIRKQS